MNADELKEFFKSDRFVAYAGIEILSVNEQRAVVGAKIMQHHFNAHGLVQGGMLFTLADFAFAVLGNFLHPVTLTQSASISYVAATSAAYITAEATELVRNGRSCVCQVVIKDDAGNIVTTAVMNGFIKTL